MCRLRAFNMKSVTGSNTTISGLGGEGGDIWTHVRYHETVKKTEHVALTEGKQCGHKRQLKARHKETEVSKQNDFFKAMWRWRYIVGAVFYITELS